MGFLDRIKVWGFLKYMEPQRKYLDFHNNQVIVITHCMNSADIEVSYWIRTDNESQFAYQHVTFTHLGKTILEPPQSELSNKAEEEKT